MDRDSNDVIASQILNGMGAGILILFGASMVIWGWGPGLTGGLPIILAGIAMPLWHAYKESERKTQKASRASKREPADGYEINSKGFNERRRR
jgi:hypothetical protein